MRNIKAEEWKAELAGSMCLCPCASQVWQRNRGLKNKILMESRDPCSYNSRRKLLSGCFQTSEEANEGKMAGLVYSETQL